MTKHKLDGKEDLTFDDYAQLLIDYYKEGKPIIKECKGVKGEQNF